MISRKADASRAQKFVKFDKKRVDCSWMRAKIRAIDVSLGVWCNGNTGDSDSLVRGSNPCTPTDEGDEREFVPFFISLGFHARPVP